MSFTSDTKKELTTLVMEKKCCQLAEISGFLRFAGSVTMGRGGFGIKLTTDNPAVARLYVQLIKDYFGAKTSLTVLEPVQLQKNRQYELRITTDMNSEAILREAGILSVKEGSNIINPHFNSDIIKKRCCKKAMLRGIFLASASVSDPNKSYHLEISCDSSEASGDLLRLINSFGLKSKVAQRRGKQVVYLKDGEQIKDFLALIGVSGQYFKYENAMMTKEMRNTANRITNCDKANTDRAIAAAQKQLADIKLIKDIKGLDYLNAKLRAAAVLRMENTELTLDELKELFDPPISKSGLNHRLSKITEIADNIRKEGPQCQKRNSI